MEDNDDEGEDDVEDFEDELSDLTVRSEAVQLQVRESAGQTSIVTATTVNDVDEGEEQEEEDDLAKEMARLSFSAATQDR